MKWLGGLFGKRNNGNEEAMKELSELLECLEKAEAEEEQLRILFLKKDIERIKREHKIK